MARRIGVHVNTANMRKWSKREIRHLLTSYKIMTYKELAADLGRSVESIDSMVKKLHLRKMNPRWSEHEKSFIMQYYKRMPMKQLAAYLGRSENVITRMFRFISNAQIRN